MEPVAHARTSYSKNIQQINENLQSIVGDKKGQFQFVSSFEPPQKRERSISVNLDPGGKTIHQNLGGPIGGSMDSVFSAKDSLLSFGSTISTGSYNSAGMF